MACERGPGSCRARAHGRSRPVSFRCIIPHPLASLEDTDGVEGSGTLATVFFRPVATGKSDLRLADVTLVAAEIAEGEGPTVILHEAVDTAIQIGGGGDA